MRSTVAHYRSTCLRWLVRQHYLLHTDTTRIKEVSESNNHYAANRHYALTPTTSAQRQFWQEGQAHTVVTGTNLVNTRRCTGMVLRTTTRE